MIIEQYDLKHLIGSSGLVPDESRELARVQEANALRIMESFLGCTIIVGNKRYILSNLELYYGGIGDMAHDWYRSMFPERYGRKSKHSKSNTEAQISKGPIFYFNQKGDGRFKRCDIVVGNDGVAVSFLIRNVLDENLAPLGSKNGQPNVAIKKMQLDDSYHMQPVVIKDTHAEILSKGFKIERNKRFTNGKYDGFDYDCIHAKKEWNYRLVY